MNTSLNQLPTPTEMVDYLNKTVHGQSRAKHDLSVAVYNHYISQAHLEAHGQDLGRHHILLIGPTGVGKTYVVKQLAAHLGVPFVDIPATEFTETGYKGKDVSAVVEALLVAASGDKELAERGIVFLDEIDKVREQKFSNDKPDNVQQDLLRYLDGLTTGVGGKTIDTSQILFIASGAFVELEEIIDARVNVSPKPAMGFHLRDSEQEEKITPRYKLLTQVQTADLIKFGMIPEFIGRFTNVAVLHALSKSDLINIITTKEDSSLRLHQRMAELHGLKLEYDTEALEFIAAEAEKLGTGARGLNRILGQVVDHVEHRFPELANEGVNKVVITLETVRDRSMPTLKKGKLLVEREDEILRKSFLKPRRVKKDTSSSKGKIPDLPI